MTKKLTPLRQGDLDGLCSIYACFNAIRYIKGDDFMSVKSDYLGACKIFMSLFGANILNLDVVLNGAEVDTVLYSLEFLKSNFDGFDFKSLKRKENIFKLVDKGPVIVGFSGIDDHWTVITHYDDEHFHLFDSSHYTKFKIDDVLFNPRKVVDDKICISIRDIISVYPQIAT